MIDLTDYNQIVKKQIEDKRKNNQIHNNHKNDINKNKENGLPFNICSSFCFVSFWLGRQCNWFDYILS